MLSELKISNILLMENIELEFNHGLTAITGQTGSGKSVLLDSIGIILGKKAETGILRNSNERGIITATFENKNKQLHDVLYENGFINKNESNIIIKKIITKNGSKIFINDIQTTVQFVNKIAKTLLEIYSQFEQTDLFDTKKHLTILDDFGNFNENIETIKILFNNKKQAEDRYQQTKNSLDKQKENLEYLKTFIQEYEGLCLQEDEYTKLLAERKKIVDNEKIATYMQNSYSLFSDAEITTFVKKIQDNLQHAEHLVVNNDNLKNSFNAINEALENIYNSTQITAEILDDFVSNYSFNEEQLSNIEQRISVINEFSRKYKITPYEIYNQYQTVKKQMNELTISDKVLEELQVDCQKKKQEYLDFAKKLSDKRKIAAKQLEKMIIQKLANLKMDKVVFFVSFEETEASETGIDKVVFFASMNTGLEPAPIHKIASGGELSRFMLAFKSSLCETKNTATIIFDEIDTGVNGSVAFAIGKEMKQLSKYAQVICITHNAQTAACANEHFFVEKKQSTNTTTTIVKKLTQNDRIKAIAEMFSGDEITNEALKNAEFLLKNSESAG